MGTRITRCRCSVLPMALDTISHIQLFYLMHFRHVRHIAVTLHAINSLGNVRSMIKKNKIGHVVNFDPLKRFSIGRQLFHFLNMRTIWFHNTVAIQTNIHRRYRGVPPLVDFSVTILTIDFQLARVRFVIKRNRLFRCITAIIR